ncbi:MAG: CBS domain-containing protein [Planctomycetota bacterium]|nr:MAG: CBS domain-containing protein [Planctomycetota bacterium]
MKLISELLDGRPRVTLPPHTTALAASRAMTDFQVGAVLVVDADGTPLGIFTERDLMTRVIVAGLDPSRTLIERVMSRDVYCVSPERKLVETAREMQSRHIRHLPVIANQRFLGMLSLRDVLRELLNDKTREVEELTAYIQATEIPDENRDSSC